MQDSATGTVLSVQHGRMLPALIAIPYMAMSLEARAGSITMATLSKINPL